MWDPDVDNWEKENILLIPRRNEKENDEDYFSALKRAIDKLISNDALAKAVSVHNISALTSLEKPIF